MLARIEVSDPEQYKKYVEASSNLAGKFGGRFLARGGRTHVLEGPQEMRRVVVIEFPSLKQAQDWFASPEYQEARALRVGAAQAEFLVVEGT